MTLDQYVRDLREITARHSDPVEITDLVDPGTIRVAAHELEGDGLGLIRRQPLLGECHQLPVDPGAKNIAGLYVEVGRTALDRRLDDFFHVCSNRHLSRFNR